MLSDNLNWHILEKKFILKKTKKQKKQKKKKKKRERPLLW